MVGQKKKAPRDLRKLEEMARAIVERHLGSHPRHLEYQTTGLSNHVFVAEHPCGQLIVRISPDKQKLSTYRKEKWAIGRAREAGIPTAEIVAVGDEVVSLPYMLSRRILGREATLHKDRLAILRQLGAHTAQINKIRTHGFGEQFDWNEEAKPLSWDAFLEEELNVDGRIETLLRNKMITAPRAHRIQNVLKTLRVSVSGATLNHGDIRLKNVMVNRSGKITGIIDWEHCLSSKAPPWELSIALHDLSIDEKEAFLEGYGLPDGELSALAPAVKALNALHYAPFIERAARHKEERKLELYRSRLAGTLDLYSL
jgi:hygromycin-B 4-O-kinase